MNRRLIIANGIVLAGLGIIAGNLLSLHSHSEPWWPGMPSTDRLMAALATLVAYVLVCLGVWWHHRPHRDTANNPISANETPILVAWASQSGFAEELARHTAQQLRQQGRSAQLRALDQIDETVLTTSRQALFIASTTGEGDPPDHALIFVRNMMSTPLSLSHLQYAVLALGDRRYTQFCAFGRQLKAWLSAQGAQLLFDMVKVNRADSLALRQWQQRVQSLGAISEASTEWQLPQQTYTNWQLHSRQHLNPGSSGAPVFHLTLKPKHASLPQWQAGDIAEISPRQAHHDIETWMVAHGFAIDTVLATGSRLYDKLAGSYLPQNPSTDPNTVAQSLTPLPPRDYSIASLPEEGALQLLVRLHHDSDGRLGLGSGWLCNYAEIGAAIALRLRPQRHIHPPAATAPLILIGNGTGMAGLRAHLRARMQSTHPAARRNWLLLGERHQAADFHFGTELQSWQQAGWIERLDTAFSRDGQAQRYVQDVLAEQLDTLRRWLDEGAALIVCGSAQGMAPAVDTLITDLIGQEGKEHLIQQHRYIRDVY